MCLFVRKVSNTQNLADHAETCSAPVNCQYQTAESRIKDSLLLFPHSLVPAHVRSQVAVKPSTHTKSPSLNGPVSAKNRLWVKFSEIGFFVDFQSTCIEGPGDQNKGDIVDHHDTACVQTWCAHRFMIIFMQQANRVDCQCQDLYIH